MAYILIFFIKIIHNIMSRYYQLVNLPYKFYFKFKTAIFSLSADYPYVAYA